MLFETLYLIAAKLNKLDVLWGLGGSVMLNHYGLVNKPNDIDILVDIKDIEKVDNLLKKIGEKVYSKKNNTYSTKFFQKYIINGVYLDVMAGFRINFDNKTYKYIFNKDSITNFKYFNGIDIPLTSLEDWYIIYQLIPNREEKVKIIEQYLKNDCKRLDLLKNALKGNLPIQVRKRTETLLSLIQINKECQVEL